MTGYKYAWFAKLKISMMIDLCKRQISKAIVVGFSQSLSDQVKPLSSDELFAVIRTRHSESTYPEKNSLVIRNTNHLLFPSLNQIAIYMRQQAARSL
jgi:hypothetical protein